MKRLLLPMLAVSALATGCYTRGDVGVGYSYGYASAGPDLYYLSPGVSVVAYADRPTFYSDNYYWMYSDGLWYRSGYYGGGWAVSYEVPYHVRSINRPHSYTRFTPGQGWTRVGARGSYDGRTRYNANQSAPPPAYAAPRGGRPHTAPARSTYTPPAARASGGGSYNPPPARAGGSHGAPRGGGPTVRDHRRK